MPIKPPPQTTTPYARGTIFKSYDGNAVVFTASAPITDPVACNNLGGGAAVSGTLVMRNGMQYTVANGYVTKATDRNGNQLLYNYSGGQLNSIQDSYNRTTTIAHSQTDPGSGKIYDQITHPGASGVSRTVKVWYDSIENTLRADELQKLQAGPLADTTNPCANTGGSGPNYIRASATQILPFVCQLFPSIPSQPTNSPQYFSYSVISRVELPNTDGNAATSTGKYRFYYNVLGEIARVELPTGGAYEYDYQNKIFPRNQTAPIIWVAQRQLSERRVYVNAGSSTYSERITYSYVTDAPTQITTATVSYFDSTGNQLSHEVHKFNAAGVPSDNATLNGWLDSKEFQVAAYDSTGATVLRTTNTTWDQRDCTTDPMQCWWTGSLALTNPATPAHDPRITSVMTTLNDALSPTASTVSYLYDQYNNRTHTLESGFNGALIRDTQVAYKTDSNYVQGPNLVSLPIQQSVCTIYDPGCINQTWPTKVSDVQYTYDAATLLTDAPGALQHDSAYGTGNNIRGNVTSVVRWAYNPVTSTTNNLTTTVMYDTTGNVTRVIDKRGVQTDYSYGDAAKTYALPIQVNSYNTVNPNSNPPSQTFTASATYDYNIGRATSTTDTNNQPTSYTYTDSLDRLMSVTRPDSSHTSFSYLDTAGSVSETTTTDLDAGLENVVSTKFDGLGREISSFVSEGSGQYICTQKAYDGKGRLFSTSNPTETSSTASCPAVDLTTTTFDALDRPAQVLLPDTAVAKTLYAGNLVVSVDPANKTRQTSTDAAGRLIEVIENPTTGLASSYGYPATPTYTTDYFYDVSNNLVNVSQGVQSRTFSYDTANRLVRANNPESGIIQYAYDDSGNLAAKTAANQIVTTAAYDGINRVMRRSYSDNLTPQVVYCYDGQIQTPEPTACPGATVPSGPDKGRLTYAGNSVSFTELDYNNRGFATMSRQTTAGGAGSPYLFGYTYTVSGGLKRITYPSGRTVTNTFDAAGRIATVLGSGNKMYATSLSGAIQYWPHGAIKQMTHANGLVETTTVNNRLQPTAIQASSLLTLGYKYTPPVGHTTPTTVGNNGNIYEQTVTPGTASSMYIHYDYDGLNRIQWASGYDAAGAPDPSTNLTCASGTSPASAWCHHYSMDAYGNRLIDNRGGLSIPPGEPTAISASTNRAAASGAAQWGYDSNGNVMVDGAGNSFTYDAENRQLTGGGAAYQYDGEGRRVARTLSGGTATFVYDAAGQLAAEYGAAGPASPCGATCYVTADHLGSTRLVTNQSMVPVERVDYLPYGEEMTFTAGTVQAGAPGYGFYAAGDVRQRFTGKERDGETGLDWFEVRYMGAVQGRFTSPDSPSYANRKNPQTWNLYAYALNNPVTFADADGHEIVCANNAAQCQKDAAAATGSVEAAKRVSTTTRTTQHSFLGIHWTTSHTTIAISGDLASFRALSPNASRLADVVGSKQTVTVNYDDIARPSFMASGILLKGGSMSYVPSQNNDPQAFIDPARTPGAVYDPDAVGQGLPQANTAEEFGHEVLGHIWGELNGGHSAGTRANMRDSIAGENVVRKLDPARGQKGIESHHNYNEMPPDKK